MEPGDESLRPKAGGAGGEAARPDPASEPVTRRRLLVWTAGLAAGAAAAALGALALPPVVAPMFRRQRVGWAPVGRVDAPAPGQPDLSIPGAVVATTVTRTVTDAYLPPAPQKTPVFVVCGGGGQFTVLDARCTHLGCPLSWDPASSCFRCACHGGVFTKDGRVHAGPPPRPLDRYEWKVENGVLYVGRLRKGQS